MSNWKPGDRAIIKGAREGGAIYNGEIVIVRSHPFPHPLQEGLVVMIDKIGVFHQANVLVLHPLPPDEKGSWEDVRRICGWKPKELIRVESSRVSRV